MATSCSASRCTVERGRPVRSARWLSDMSGRSMSNASMSSAARPRTDLWRSADVDSPLPDPSSSSSSIVTGRGDGDCQTLGDVTCSDVGERDGWADRGARTGILVAHHRRRRVARGVQALDHLAVLTQYSRVAVAHETAFRTQIARHQFERVERGCVERTEARVRPGVWVGVVPVVGALSTMEVDIDTALGETVEAVDGGRQTVGWNSHLSGELGDGRRQDRDAAVEPLPRNRLTRQEWPNLVLLPKRLMDDEPRRHVRHAARLALVHRVDDVDVRRGFVGEPLSQRVDDDPAAQLTLVETEGRGARWQEDARAPPGVVHQRQARVQLQPGARRA